MQKSGTDTWFMPDSLQVDVLLSALAGELSVVTAPELTSVRVTRGLGDPVPPFAL